MQFFRLFIVTIFVHLMLCGTSPATPLQNGDFSSFSGWEGVIWDGTSETYVDPASDTHFKLITGGMAQLSNDSTYFEIALFQEFDLPSDTSTISFDFEWDKTDEWDMVQATLYDSTYTVWLDLFPSTTDFDPLTNSGTATTDILSWAGSTVTIEFFLQDGDWDEKDLFEIGNINITPIPEPCTMMLLGTGLIMGIAPRLRKYFSA
jgi:hypothetical protein